MKNILFLCVFLMDKKTDSAGIRMNDVAVSLRLVKKDNGTVTFATDIVPV